METQIFEIAKLFLPVFIAAHLDELEGRKGVHLAIRNLDYWAVHPIISETIGEIPAEKEAEKKAFSHEKINRLINRHKTNHVEVCSFESENISEKQFGGAIVARNYYVSASGFPAHLDQKFVLLVCLLTEEIGFTPAADIDHISYPWQEKWKK